VCSQAGIKTDVWPRGGAPLIFKTIVCFYLATTFTNRPLLKKKKKKKTQAIQQPSQKCDTSHYDFKAYDCSFNRASDSRDAVYNAR
jgi:hypothetical protein